MTRPWKTHILLGKGGQTPGLTVYDVVSQSEKPVLSLTVGQSVYAVDVSPDGDRVVAGSKRGDLYVVPDCLSGGEGDPSAVRPCIQGVSVLSVCFLDDRHFAASDVAGRCLLWDLADGGQPSDLPVPDGGVIHSLFHPDDRHLVGLCADRRMVIWEWRSIKTVRTVEIPPSPPTAALVRPVYWAEGDCWAWPNRGGALGLFAWPSGQHRTVDAHQGGFYGIAVVDGELWTVGHKDGCLKRWGPDSDRPLEILTVPTRIVSAAAWHNRGLSVVLVDETGRAGLYLRQGDVVTLTAWLRGAAYRMAVSPDPEALRSLLRQRAESQARVLAADIREQYSRNHPEEVGRLQSELGRIGYAHVGMVLEAEEARRRGDMAQELGAYSRLVSLLPDDHVGLAGSLLRYAEVLERSWQIKDAYAICGRYAKVTPTDSVAAEETRRRLHSYIEVMESHEYVVEALDPLSALLAGATALNRPLVGRYVLRIAGPSVKCYGMASSVDVIERYEQARCAAYQGTLPAATERSLAWLSQDGIENTDAVILTVDRSKPPACVEYCLRIWVVAGNTVFAPRILIKVGKCLSGMTASEHNHQVSCLLEHIQASASHQAMIKSVHECLRQIIGRLVTRQLAIKSYERGDQHV